MTQKLVNAALELERLAQDFSGGSAQARLRRIVQDIYHHLNAERRAEETRPAFVWQFPRLEAVQRRVDAMFEHIDDARAGRRLTVTLEDSDGTRCTITGSTQTALEYLNGILDGLDVRDEIAARHADSAAA